MGVVEGVGVGEVGAGEGGGVVVEELRVFAAVESGVRQEKKIQENLFE